MKRRVGIKEDLKSIIREERWCYEFNFSRRKNW
jgi:hypothetical protein